MRICCICIMFLIAPVMLLANNSAPFVMSAGAIPGISGERDCTACHTGFPVNPPGGSLTVETSDYRPEIRQIVRLIVSHPAAGRWGFQVTARLARDHTRAAGRFTSDATVRVLCPPSANEGPCNGPEYATHRGASTGGGTAGTRIYEIEWTPPTIDEGEVVFYIAAMAADANNTESGDRVYVQAVTIRANAFCSLPNRPAITRVENGASFEPVISPNGMVAIKGNNLFSSGDMRNAVPANGVFPKEVNCVAVEIDGKRAPMTYVSSDQINAQAPADIAIGPVQVRVIMNPGRPNEFRSDPATVTSAAVAPAFFLFYSGQTPRSIAALHADYSILANPSVFAFPGAHAARPGDIVLLYANGFGRTNPLYQAGDIPQGMAQLTEQITVTIGNVTLSPGDILYAGLTPQSISGLYQFNLRIPATVADGDVPVSIRIGGATTPAAGAVIPVRR